MIYLDVQPGDGHLKGFPGRWISLRWRAQDEGSPKVELHPANPHLNGFKPVLDGQPFVVSKGNKSDPKRLILDVAVGLQCRVLSKPFSASWCLTWIWPDQIVRKKFLQPYVK